MSQQQTSPFSLMPIIICVLGGSFILYEFVLQVAPGVMTEQLMRDLSIGSVGLGVMSGFFYYGYTPMQLPAGILYDKFGPRILLTIAVAICATGAVLFGSTSSVEVASLGRLLMGVGAAFSFIGGLVLVARWFPAKYFALLAGLVQLMACLGAIVGQDPVALAVEHFGWRHTITTVAIAGYLLSVSIWLVVRDGPSVSKKQQKKADDVSVWKKLKLVSAKKQTWVIAIYAFLIWAPIVVVAALWGDPFLMVRYHIGAPEAAIGITITWIGIAIGSPLIGLISDRIGRRCLPLSLCALLGVLSSLVIVYVPISWNLMLVMLFLFGLAASGQALSFAVMKENHYEHSVGTAVGINNMAVVAGGLFLQPLVGWILHETWSGDMVNGVQHFTYSDFRSALFIVPLCYLGAAITSAFFMKETRCQSLAD